MKMISLRMYFKFFPEWMPSVQQVRVSDRVAFPRDPDPVCVSHVSPQSEHRVENKQLPSQVGRAGGTSQVIPSTLLLTTSSNQSQMPA